MVSQELNGNEGVKNKDVEKFCWRDHSICGLWSKEREREGIGDKRKKKETKPGLRRGRETEKEKEEKQILVTLWILINFNIPLHSTNTLYSTNSTIFHSLCGILQESVFLSTKNIWHKNDFLTQNNSSENKEDRREANYELESIEFDD